MLNYFLILAFSIFIIIGPSLIFFCFLGAGVKPEEQTGSGGIDFRLAGFSVFS